MAEPTKKISRDIHLWGIKQNNLKDVEVKIPIGKTTVVCGPSGSGKSSLAFETLFAEGQRRFIESMSNYARQFLNKAPKPDIEGVTNIPPAISIEQKNSVKNSRSTVGTTTELIDYLRLFYEKLGVPYCPSHNVPCEKQSVVEACDLTLQKAKGQRGYILVKILKGQRVAEGKKLHSLLLQDGYLRFLGGKDLAMQELSDPKILKSGLPKEDFFLVVDRMAFNPDEQGRLTDSLTQAYEASVKYNTQTLTRRCVVRTVDGAQLEYSEEKSCPICQYTPPPVTSRLFSFNSPIGACPTCKGFGNILTLDEQKVIPNPNLSIGDGALQPFMMPSAAEDFKTLKTLCKKYRISLAIPWKDLKPDQRKRVWEGEGGYSGVVGLFAYLEEIKYKMHVRVFLSRFRSPHQCEACHGSRLRPAAEQVFFQGKNITELSRMTIGVLFEYFSEMKLSKFQLEIAQEVYKQICSRLNFLIRVGVPYLSMSRETRTLSGGEYQRLTLANQLGMGLSQTLYVLDEPTVGLHPRDNDRLISVLDDLKKLGNTLVIVEHDQDVIASADHILEMGPGSGILGGKVVYAGAAKQFLEVDRPEYAKHHRVENRVIDPKAHKFNLELLGASGHNLKNVNVHIPLRKLVCVTGVSGSGKSTLITKTLYPAVARALNVEFLQAQPFESLEGTEHLQNVSLIDQSSIGKSARSSPVTYLKAFDAIRELMAQLTESKVRGYTPGTFSLNVDGGRCPACRGTGIEEIDMQFMDNVIMDCEVCNRKKYRPEILEIKYKDKNIFEILQMTVSEAMSFFVAYPNIRKPLSLMKEVGLDYLQIGQAASTLSGGESQRLKIAKELSQFQSRDTLYILDEPTTGLHFREVELLLRVLHRLIDTGASVIVIEHNLDVIASSDHVIDLGPEAGFDGGYIVATGSPEDIMRNPKSLTGKYLKRLKF